ncbi:hypothetical protein [Rhizobium sp. L1K21]|uniref:hypothetical protein n=1 Tax=Rhizobium sp. L1K21 TaxID=2954933 RepID=UPI0020938A46|nr:hypothetical protein [Rhizobium sp. L1K21]MCO6187774.1 hypothetical protein [Rhizobium sp. L1K21]
MREAIRIARSEQEGQPFQDDGVLEETVVRLYARGMVDPARLGQTAALLAKHRRQSKRS